MTTILDLLSTGDPDSPALLSPGGMAPTTYSQLRATIERMGGQLRALGVRREDRVAIVLPNGEAMATAFLAVASCATAAPLNPRYREDELRFYLRDLCAKALVTLPGEAEAAQAAAPETLRVSLEGTAPKLDFSGAGTRTGAARAPEGTAVDWAQPDEVALVLHTSGTTSRPKIVPLRQRNLTVSARNIGTGLGLTAEDRCLNVMPLFHIHGLVGALLASLGAGGSVACTPGFDAFKFFNWLDELAPTWFTAVPTMHQIVLSRAFRYQEVIARSRLRFVRSSSASLPTVVLEEVDRVFGVPMIEAYGMTEASHQMASNPLPPGVRKPGSVGRGTGIDVAIMADDGRLLGARKRGEVAIRGPTVITEYENNPDATAGAFSDGWFRSGDQGYLDDEGYLFLTGRLKEFINRGGEKVSPLEVDEVLLRHPAVAQAVAFAMPHAKLGEEVAAAVVLTEPGAATEREIHDFAAQHLTDFKVPRTVMFLAEIPKGPTGKVQRIGLAERLGLS